MKRSTSDHIPDVPFRHIDAAFLAELATTLLPRRGVTARQVVGIAGIPGSGKSTFATMLVDALNNRIDGAATLVPMDGFHHSNQWLHQHNLMLRKGASETFDATGYLALLKNLRCSEISVPFPVYDRERHEPVLDPQSDHVITASTQVVITEGNYLLLDTEPWLRLATILDACWWLDTPMDTARRWILARHVRGGRTPEDAATHYARNDAANAHQAMQCMRIPDLILRWPGLDHAQ